MTGILKVTPEQLIATANEFQSIGTTVRNLTGEMTNIVTGLSSIWEGEAATAYTAKFNGLQDDIERLHAMITEHVTDLNDMANVYSNAEKTELDEIATLSSDVIV
ncbi:MAG: WXG100 family type VII secretion target [Eubacteriales bacterium]|nr:WXG100 family type VII secretion target [Eubacteriales bacterium]